MKIRGSIGKRLSMIRLQKFLSNAGIASRRKCAKIIEARHVKVNGRVVTSPWLQIDPDKDKVFVKDKRVNMPEKVYLILNKPKECITSLNDPEGRRTVMDYLKGLKAPVFPAGRLDYDSSGLIFFTNDGELAYRLTHPKFKVPKTYLVKLNGRLDEKRTKRLEKGLLIDNIPTGPVKIEEIRQDLFIYQITVSEGRKHLVKNLFMKVGLRVKSLKRIEFGTLYLDKLKRGTFRYLMNKEVLSLKRLVGL